MTRNLYRPGALAMALLVAISPVLAQQPAGSSPAAGAVAGNPANSTFSQQDLDQLLAPIALYPDALLAQILMASTYPLEVVEAARWSKANPKLSGKALEDALTKQPWDPAVKSLTAVPTVLAQMNDKLDWTQKLGDAFLAQQQDVMTTVQSLRAKADAAGNLKSSEQLVVKKETQASQTIYIVESPKTEVIYVPTYNPSVVYGVWWYPVPPYYVYPPAYVYSPGLVFATGVVVGAAIWGNCNWGWGHGHSNINVNVNHYNSFNRTTISNTNWNHNVDHRKGVAYRDQNVAKQYNRGSDARAAASREQFRGRAESGRAELNTMDKSSLNQRVQNADHAGQRAGGDYAAQRPIDRTSGTGGKVNRSGGDYAAHRPADRSAGTGSGSNRASDRSGGFAGVGNGAATRDASARGSASRASMGSRPSGGAGSRGGGGGGHRR